MKIKTLLLALALAAPLLQGRPAAAQEGPSWCGNGGLSTSERAICRDSRLRDLDARLNEAYRATGREALDADQRAWLDRREACGSDILCLERAYEARIRVLSGQADSAPVPQEPMRPWCDDGSLNATEEAVCSDDLLADLDAALEAVYGSLRAEESDTSQVAWLREERDGCGSDSDCIAQAYLRRIVELGGRLREQ